MNLYCWQHNGIHRLTAGEVERVVYALTAAHADALAGNLGPPHDGADAMKLLVCPLHAGSWAGDAEMYAEHVEQGVECRRALEREARP